MAILSGPQSWTKKHYELLNTIRESSCIIDPNFVAFEIWTDDLKFRMHASDFIGIHSQLIPIEDWTALTLRRSVKTAVIWHGFDEPNVDISPAFVYRSTNRLSWITWPRQEIPQKAQHLHTIHSLPTSAYHWWLEVPQLLTRDNSTQCTRRGFVSSKAFYNRLVLVELWLKMPF